VFKKAPERQIRNCGEMLDGSGLETHYRINVDRPTVIANNYADFFGNWNYFGVQASQVPRLGAITCVYLLNTAAQVVQVPRLNFLARPGSLAQKSQAGFYAWVACETAHVNSLRQSFPAMSIHQDGQDGFKSHALKWIVRVLCHSIESSKFTSPQSQTARPNPTSFAAGQCRSRPLGVIPAHAASKNRHTAFIVRFMQSSLFEKNVSTSSVNAS